MITQDFLFLDSTSGTYSNELAIIPESEEMTLHVEALSGTPNLTIQGKTDALGNWQTIGAVKLSDYSVVSAVSANGIYSIPVAGVQRVRIHNSGTAGTIKAYGRITGN